jgi:hypothetical protein
MTQRRRAWFAAAAIALAAGRGAAQLDWQAARERLADPDRDDVREVALRSLVAQRESPADLMRAWAAGGDWRRQQSLLRVLGERGELAAAEAAAALQDARWVVRAAAARAAGQSPGTKGLDADLQRLLADPWPAVREEALVALQARGELPPAALAAALRAPGTRASALAIVAAAAREFDGVVGDALTEPSLRGDVLLRLRPDCGPETTAALARLAASGEGFEVRAAALLALPRHEWLVDPVPIVLGGLDAKGGDTQSVQRLAALLDPAMSARLVADALDDPDPERFRARLDLVRRLPESAAARLLAASATCPPERLNDCLRLLARLGTPGLVARAAEVLASPLPDPVLRPWLMEVGPLVAADAERRSAVARFLAGDGELAATAFRILVAQRVVDEPVLAYARREAREVAARASVLLGASAETPARYWLDLLGHADPQLRWTAAKGLAVKLGEAGVARALLAALATEAVPHPRTALVSTLLLAADQAVVLETVESVLTRGDAELDRTLLGHLAVGKQSWLDRVLDALEGSRFGPELPRLRARRGDLVAARTCLQRLPSMSATQARTLREPLARCLQAGDLPLLAGWLGAAGGEAAPSWLREETIAWLRARRDLDATALLERALSDEWLEVRSLAAAALVERGRREHLLPLIEAWIAGDEDVEAILIEVLASLPAPIGDVETRFLVRLLVAPVLQDPEQQMAAEIGSKALTARVDSLHPLLRPTIEVLARADRQSFARTLADELLAPRLRTAWTCASKDYLLRGLRLAVANPPAAEVIEPVLEWAMRLSPRRPDVDGPLLLLQAQAQARSGQHAPAASTLRRALVALAMARLPVRTLELLTQEILDSGSADGLAAVAACAYLHEAVAAAAAGRRQAAVAAGRCARSLAREDAAFERRIADELRRLTVPLSDSEDSGR